MRHHSLRQSLNELERVRHPQAISNSSTNLVARCAALRNKALQDYTVEDLRLSIGQSMGLPWLVPLALTQLQQDLLAEGDHYPGDLLSMVSRLPTSYWQAHPADLKSFVRLLHTRLPTSPPATMPASAFREVQHQAEFLAALLV